jgi:GT2 family glycosyltransferase
LNVGIVIIGRNEGARLVRCLESLRSGDHPVVYVDSGSTDDSVNEARSRGVSIVNLDMNKPFSAARARNAGFHYLTSTAPDIGFVHFFDGDCEVDGGWITKATAFLSHQPGVGVVFGIQKERFPRASIYNELIDIEWDTPRGAVKSCAGNALCRRGLFQQLDGFRESLIAGEDPEFCLRVRETGALIWHLDEPMVLHDASLHRFSQWWRRTKRGGYAFAEGAALHGTSPERHFVRETRSAIIWAVAIPVVALILALFVSPWLLLVLLVYPLQMLRIARSGMRSRRSNLLNGAFVVLAKFPEAAGCLQYLFDRLHRRPHKLIEYK